MLFVMDESVTRIPPEEVAARLQSLSLRRYCEAGGTFDEAERVAIRWDATRAVGERVWRNKHGSIWTFGVGSDKLDVYLDATGRWLADQYRPADGAAWVGDAVISTDPGQSLAVLRSRLLGADLWSGVEVWGAEDEMVVMLASGATLYIERGTLSKVVSSGPLGEASRELARRVLRRVL